VTVETGVVTLEGPASDVAEAAAGFFYAAFVLPPAARRAMLAELSDLLSAPAPVADGAPQARFAMPINRLVVVT
jgi:hypothetical protein